MTIADRISYAQSEFVEAHVQKAIEKAEGRVPSDAEVAQLGHCVVFPDGEREYRWRGKSVLRITPKELFGLTATPLR